MQKHIIALFCAAGMAVSTPLFAASLKIKPNAPARYVVKPGDTLWSISGKYLYRPWQWPALWNVNRSKIRNPHWIYPGQELYLSYVNGRPVLSTRKGKRKTPGGIPTIKLRPEVIDMGSGYGIPTINVNFYGMFMKHPQFVTDAQIAHAPRIVAGVDSRTVYTKGDRIYADGPIEPGTYMVFRIKENLKDTNGKGLGKLAEFSGEVSTLPFEDNAYADFDPSKLTDKQRAKVRDGEYFVPMGTKLVPVRSAQPMMVTESISEIMRGDYLLRKPDVLKSFNVMPHAPEGKISPASIISVMDGIAEGGMTQSIILNRGSEDGLDPGTVLSIYRPNRVVKTEWNPTNKLDSKFVNLPTQEIGLAMVYRTDKYVSSAVILESTTNVSSGDILREPGQDMDTSADVTTTRDGLVDKTPGFWDDADVQWDDVLDAVK